MMMEETDAELDKLSPTSDDISAASVVYRCAECVREEREFSCHSVDRVAIVAGEVVCLDCIAEFFPKAKVRKITDVAVKLKRQRMVIADGQKKIAALNATQEGK